ncbi:hypothetical protein [Polluticaenibacter yanchengensis]|uniref:DUF3307 domain-containing protein n=1 Tax=Polluticaenibacter yanchengensis TaxID=3014562 RepID=A0ABT4UIQ1_9BACT|nr:hypothetical protein [Chitinophagaceae bacterium LY-5]
MEQILNVIGLIDWYFLVFIILVGHFWADKYFRVFKEKKYNFLAFATLAGGIYLLAKLGAGEFKDLDPFALLLTYFVATSFYSLFAKAILDKIKGL